MLNRRSCNSKRLIRNMFYAVCAAGMVYSCASIGKPDGGEFDETPPRFIGSTPSAGAINNTRTRIVLEFDEYIKLEKPGEKIVFSPPQIMQPELKPSGKKVTINLLDSLKPNTTYTIDFSDAIVDNNESNPLGDFTFTFSTGEVIDTMAVSGVLLEAANLEPVKGMLVGLHANLADSAFTTLPFDRVSRTDSRGRFTIRGIAPGTYRIFALMDADQNYVFSQKSEAIAFYDSLIVPHFEERMRQDTMWRDSLTIDTIIHRKYTHYLPDDIYLRSFKEESFYQYLVKSERLEPHKFTLYFNAKADTLPTIRGLNFDEKDAFIIEKAKRNDTIQYWIKDSLLYQKDTLRFALDYLYTDTLNMLVPRTDTLKLAMRKQKGGNQESENKESRNRRRGKDKGEEEEPEPTKFLNMKSNVSGSMDVFATITLSFEEPIAFYDSTAIHLKQKVDTLWYDVPFVFEQDTMDVKKFNIYPDDWVSQGEYEFSVDSLAFYGLYGLHTDKLKSTFKIKSDTEDYGTILFNITGAGPTAYVELLDAQDKVLRKRPVINGNADFYYLPAGKYCARLINDRNENGVWDTGNYEQNIQPEEVFYYWQILDLKVRFELNQDWDLNSHSLDKQKPDEMKKQKPDEAKKKQNKNRERDPSMRRRN